MKKLAVIILALVPSLALAAGGGNNPYIVDAPVNHKDVVSLQKGATLFVNYCMGCHGMKYVRYERLANDLNIPVEMAQKHFNFTSEKPGDQMANAMPEEQAKEWFGAAPPDLSLTARLRGEDWVYSYLISFYEDETRPYGYNNHVFDMVGMPHVLAGMEQELGEDEFKKAMADLTNFLGYAAEPVRLERESLGKKVLFFLFLLFIPAYLLKREYWKDVH